MKVDLLIKDLNELEKAYNLSKEIILKILENILIEKFNIGDIFIKDNRIYERIFKQNNTKERKIRLTKKHIKIIIDELRKRLLEFSNKSKKEQLKNLYFLNVIRGQVIGKNEYCYQIKFDNNIGFLYFNKSKKKYSIGDIDYFHINKIKKNDKELIIILDDFSKNILIYKIYQLLRGIYIKKIIIQNKQIIIYTNTKIPKELLNEIKLLTKKEIIIKEVK